MAHLLRVLSAAVMILACAAPAVAKPGPIYRDPPSYKGIRRPPPVKSAPSPKPPAPIALADAGKQPEVLVDEAGTAHVVWNEDRGDSADVVVYCRIPRGATGCASRVDLHSEIPDS